MPTGKFGRLVRIADHPEALATAVSPDGAWVAMKEQGLRAHATDALLGGSAEPVWSVPLSRFGSTSAAPMFSDDSAWVIVHDPISGDQLPVQWGVAVYEATTGRHVLDLPTGSFAVVRFAAGRPIAVTAEPNGTVLVWDLRAVLAATGPAPTKGRSDANLWADLADPDPATALRAGFILLDRGRLRQLAGVGAATAPTRATTGPAWAELIADLSSTDRRTKEAAHKRLEAGGPAAAIEVRRALAAHPGGETEARLEAIARLQTDSDVPAIADATATPTDGETNAGDVRRRRVAQLLGWSQTTATQQ